MKMETENQAEIMKGISNAEVTTLINKIETFRKAKSDKNAIVLNTLLIENVGTTLKSLNMAEVNRNNSFEKAKTNFKGGLITAKQFAFITAKSLNKKESTAVNVDLKDLF